MDNAFEQLMMLRNLTERTGVIHEAQVLQMKYYAAAFLGKGASVVIEQKTPTKRSVTYKIGSNLNVNTMPKADMEMVAAWTSTLLGKDWTIRFTKGRKLLLEKVSNDGNQPVDGKGTIGLR